MTLLLELQHTSVKENEEILTFVLVHQIVETSLAFNVTCLKQPNRLLN